MTVGLFCEVFNQFAATAEKYDKIGRNTGNILFMDALKSMLDCEVIRDWEADRISSHSAFVTTELIWIRESAVPSSGMLKRIEITKGKPLVPFSIGLQADTFKPDFKIRPEMVAVLKELESRCKLPVRGAYTAEILENHGVKNIQVVGCPSVYQIPLYQTSLDFLTTRKIGAPSNAAANFRSFTGKLSGADLGFIRHIIRNCSGFIEQTLIPISETGLSDSEIIRWFELYYHIFFDLESWIRHNRRYDFSYGLRFHGNVAAILAGAPALFIAIDSRTREMTDHFRLPSLKLADFREELTLGNLYAEADYREFSAGYGKRLRSFQELAAENGLELSSRYKEALSKFQEYNL